MLQSVTTLGPNDAWAVGYRGDGYLVRGRALVEHWDGTRWTVARLPANGPSILFAVSSAGPRNVWAAGATFRSNRRGRFVPSGTQPLLLHWDGRSWQRESLPWAGHRVELDKVVATGQSSVWAVASGEQRPNNTIAGSILLEHWNGTRWRAVPAPFGQRDVVSGFGATSASNAWAVGSYAQGASPASHSHALSARWNGRAWQVEPVPNRSGNTDSVLTDVVALRPNDAWALGESQRLRITKDRNGTSFVASYPVPLFVHWDGRSWRIMPGASPQLRGGEPRLAVAKDGAAWAIGNCVYDNFVERWNGRAWAFESHPSDRHRRSRARHRGHGLSCASAAAG